MSRLPFPGRDDLKPEDRPIYDRLIAERPQPTPHIFRVVANAPKLLGSFISYGGDLRHKTVLSPRLRELAIMTVGQAANIKYEIVHHTAYAKAAGVTQAQIENLDHFRTSELFPPIDKAVMQYAKEATLGVNVADETWTAVRSFLSEQEATELVLNVAWYVAATRVIGPLKIEIEEFMHCLNE
ncbi:MAG: carboxymuconolactone decarboxylase family protein [Pseudolabrys sp.]|nr:carboxymuconolactone decarboxylase family protein [Pseudolabrys sp.]